MRVLMWAVLSVVFIYVPATAADHAVILQYHQFGSDTPRETSVTMEEFLEHVTYFEKNGFAIWPLERIITYLKQRKPLPERCVSITIDGAYDSVYDRAFPILRARGWPFTVFVTPTAVDRGYAGRLSWEQMRKMAEFGATFAGYTQTRLLSTRKGESKADWARRIKKEIEGSLGRIKTELGEAGPFFAYPFGEYNTKLKEIVLDLGLSGFGQQSGPVWSGSDFGVVPRFTMTAAYAGMNSFKTKVNSLPLPVIAADPSDPVILPDSKNSVLRLTLGRGDFKQDSVSCFLSGVGNIPVKWVDRGKKIVEVPFRQMLPLGRSRYNFTALNRDGSRYYWYSHLWIREKR